MTKDELKKANIWVKRHLAPTFSAVLERDGFLQESFRIKHKTPRGFADFYILQNPNGSRPSKFLDIHKLALYRKYKKWLSNKFYKNASSDWDAQRRWQQDIQERDEFL